MSARPLGKIQIRVREILRDGGELVEGGKRRLESERFQLVNCAAYVAYEDSLIGEHQKRIARREFDKIRRELVVYETDLFPAPTFFEELAAAAVPARPESPGLELIPEDLDIYQRRARAVVNFVAARRDRLHLEEAVV